MSAAWCSRSRSSRSACGIPITAIAVTQAGLPGLIVAWAGIVLVNVLFARSR